MSNPSVDIQTLSTQYPMALLPVRIETRFVTSPPTLNIRIYPDEIFANFHEPALTADELAAGTAYWTEAPTDAPSAWARLVARFQAPRAAWIAFACSPGSTPTSRADSLPHAQATALPTAWVVYAYRPGGALVSTTSTTVQSPLAVGYRPDIGETDPSLQTYDELKLERDLAWTIDFNLAKTFGMAVSLTIAAGDLTAGFDRVLVFGVKAPYDPAMAAADLKNLLDAHHYTRGLAFVRQGTPTNNTGTEAAGYPPPTAASYSYPIERGAALATTATDGGRTALALGIDIGTFAHVEGADRHEDDNASAMAQALWPVTFGYFLQHIASVGTAAQIADIRNHVSAAVRGRGPYPAFRVGRVPYGLLPVTSLTKWATTSTGTIDAKLPPLLGHWRTAALGALSHVARVGATADPDADLLGILAQDSAAREVRLRETIGPSHLLTLFTLLGYSSTAEASARATLVSGVQETLGLTGWTLRMTGFTYAGTAQRINRAFAVNALTSETQTLADNYIAWIQSASVSALQAAGVAGSTTFRNPLLFHLLRQAALVEYARIAVNLAIAHGAATATDALEPELLHIGPGTETRITPWTRFSTPLAAVSGTTALGDWLLQTGSTDSDRQPVRDFRAALGKLALLPTAELDRLTAETLDLGAYRLDAWITSLATRKLAALRGTHATGVHLGAFAWVENLKQQVGARPGLAGGFIHAPTPSHAAAAAILRSGYLTRTGTERDQIGVRLTSKRTRTALELIEGVRQGQPLAALLGYRFERAMHVAAMDKYIQPFRAQFPLGADPGSPTSVTSERIPARSVVNGLGLRTALAGATTTGAITWSDYPSVIATADRTAVGTCLLALDDDVDATADIALAEAIYQTVQGNTDRASTMLAGLAGGATLPSPEIATVPARVTSYTQRVLTLLGAMDPVATGWNTSAPRALANPRLDAWVAGLLGDPTRIGTAVTYAVDPDDPDTTTDVIVHLPALGLCALDVLDLARRTPPDGGGELDARLEWYVRQTFGAEGDVDIALGTNLVTPFLELFEVARRIADMVAGARALVPADVTRDGSGVPTGDATELTTRADATESALAAALDAMTSAVDATSDDPSVLNMNVLRGALWGLAAFGVRQAVPPSSIGNDGDTVAAFVEAARVSRAEVGARQNAMDATDDGLARLTAAFASEIPILPVFTPDTTASAAFDQGGDLDNGAYTGRAWFTAAARVRPALGRARIALIAAEGFGGAALDFGPAQIPQGDRWIALDKKSTTPTPGTLSMAIQASGVTTSTWSGLVYDEWTEAIPAATQTTALALNFNAPGAEAAQAVLLAVSPDTSTNWTLDNLAAILNETIDLAHLRAIDPDALGDFSQFVPTSFIAANIAGDNVGLDLAPHTMTEDVIQDPV